MEPYPIILTVHSLLRWIALAAGFGATMTAAIGSGTRADRLGLVLMVALDIQMLLGLILYLVLSPYTTESVGNFREAIRDPVIRFWVVQHTLTMFGAIMVVHAGRVLVLKTRDELDKRTRRVACFGIATVGMLVGMPWPALSYGRPLFRWILS